MKKIKKMIGSFTVFLLPLIVASGLLLFTPKNVNAGDPPDPNCCVDERPGCASKGGTVYTFSCASGICGYSEKTCCYICITQ